MSKVDQKKQEMITIPLFSIKMMLFVETCSQNKGLIVFQKILLSQIKDGFKFPK